MADLQDLTISVGPTVTITDMPTATISGRMVDSRTGTELRNFAGGSTISFPQVLKTLTRRQQVFLLKQMLSMIIEMRFGDWEDPDTLRP